MPVAVGESGSRGKANMWSFGLQESTRIGTMNRTSTDGSILMVLTGHEPQMRKEFEIKERIFRFIGSMTLGWG